MSASFGARLAHALSWKRWAWTVALSATLPLTGIYLTVFDWSVARYAGLAPWFIGFGAITLVAIAVAEASAPRDPVSMVRYLCAVFAAALVAASLGASFPQAIRRAADPPPASIVNQRAALRRPPPVIPVAYALFGGLNVLFYGLLVVSTMVRLQRMRLAARALSEAEIAREEAQGRLAASRLDAIRGRVDPEEVIRRLEEIENAYDADAKGADAMLEELIVQLRAAIPLVRTERASGVPS